MFIKLAGLSAALAGAVVLMLEATTAEGRAPAKLHYDRVAAEPAHAPVRYASTEAEVTAVSASTDGPSCSGQTWPYVDPACGSSSRKPVRTITIERREAPATSTLVRVPVETR